MQTFLPYPDFKKSAEVLDLRRLGKQRLEALDCLYVCLRHRGEDIGDKLYKTRQQAEVVWERYKNHPTVRMWRGFEFQLVNYIHAVCLEWVKRGYLDSRAELMENAIPEIKPNGHPAWLGDKAFHLSHQSNLIRKDSGRYRGIFGSGIPNDLPYIWPE